MVFSLTPRGTDEGSGMALDSDGWPRAVAVPEAFEARLVVPNMLSFGQGTVSVPGQLGVFQSRGPPCNRRDCARVPLLPPRALPTRSGLSGCNRSSRSCNFVALRCVRRSQHPSPPTESVGNGRTSPMPALQSWYCAGVWRCAPQLLRSG